MAGRLAFALGCARQLTDSDVSGLHRLRPFVAIAAACGDFGRAVVSLPGKRETIFLAGVAAAADRCPPLLDLPWGRSALPRASLLAET